MESTNCARSPDRSFDDLGVVGQVERMTVELFHLIGPMMIPSHVLGHKLVLSHHQGCQLGVNLMRIKNENAVLHLFGHSK